MSASQSSGGVGLCTVLTTVFVVLKLAGLITWSWWWVLSPIWLPLAVIVAVLPFLLSAAITFNAARSAVRSRR